MKANFLKNLKAYKLLELKTKQETEVIQVLKEMYQDLFSSLSEDCKTFFETFEVSIEPSQSLSLDNGKISFDKTSPTFYDGEITYLFTLLDF
jgi:hypothetical protein